MRIIRDLNFQLNQTVVCIGKFDGVHRGHRLLLEEAKKTALPVVMITFLFKDIQSIYSREEKETLAARLGVDVLVEIPVTVEFMRMPAGEFAERVLAGCCDAKKVIVGEDFCFGYRRAGDVNFLRRAGEKAGFEVAVLEKLREGGEIISSTRIRKLLAEGKMGEVNSLLATPYFIRGTVEEGNHIGRKIEVPTANIYPAADKVLPPFGVYAVFVMVEGVWYKGISNLGVKPTIPGENPVGLEVWFFDYQGDLYGRELTVFLVEFQRAERKFDSVEELHGQIMKDTERAGQILSQREIGLNW